MWHRLEMQNGRSVYQSVKIFCVDKLIFSTSFEFTVSAMAQIKVSVMYYSWFSLLLCISFMPSQPFLGTWYEQNWDLWFLPTNICMKDNDFSQIKKTFICICHSDITITLQWWIDSFILNHITSVRSTVINDKWTSFTMKALLRTKCLSITLKKILIRHGAGSIWLERLSYLVSCLPLRIPYTFGSKYPKDTEQKVPFQQCLHTSVHSCWFYCSFAHSRPAQSKCCVVWPEPPQTNQSCHQLRNSPVKHPNKWHRPSVPFYDIVSFVSKVSF